MTLSISYPHVHIPLANNLSYTGTQGLDISVDGGTDFATNPGALTLNGTTQALRINRGTLSVTEFRDLFGIGSGSVCLFMTFNATAQTGGTVLASIPGGTSTSCRGIKAMVAAADTDQIQMLGNNNGNVLRNKSTADYPIFAGFPVGYGLYVSIAERDSQVFVHGDAAGGSRQNTIYMPVPTTMSLSDDGSGTNTDVIFGALQANDPTDPLTQFYAGQLSEILWINFGTSLPPFKKLNRMQRQYGHLRKPGSEFVI